MEMARRLLLVGVAVFFPARGSLSQIGGGTLLCAIYLFVQQQASPFTELGDDFTAKCCSFFLLIYFGTCLVFRVLEHLEQPEARQAVELNVHARTSSTQRRVSHTLERAFVTSTRPWRCPQVQRLLNLRSADQRALINLPATTLICFLSVVGTIAFTGVIVAAQVRAERERQLREQMALRARRLRHKKSGKEVYASPLEEPLRYHLFLSHVWDTVCLGIDPS
jgi:hypothetical protein